MTVVPYIRLCAGTANKPKATYEPGDITEQLENYKGRPNLMYYRYELGKKHFMSLFTERRFYGSTFTPEKDRSTIESIETIKRLSVSSQALSLYPFWVHLVFLYHVIDTRNILITRPSDKLFRLEIQPFDRNVIDSESIKDFRKHFNELDILLIDNLLADLDLLSNEASALGEEYKLDADPEARIKSPLLCLCHLCRERTLSFENRRQITQNIVLVRHP